MEAAHTQTHSLDWQIKLQRAPKDGKRCDAGGKETSVWDFKSKTSSKKCVVSILLYLSMER